jgi:hypothetical protein
MPIVLTITADESGSVSVNGPIDNTLFCYGLLEMARDVIRKQAEEKKRSIQPVTSSELVFGRRG